MRTERKLNISCTVAPAKALSSSSPSPIWPIATIVFVTDVPMFAPVLKNRSEQEENDVLSFQMKP